jgi:hypothetical protein
MSYPRKNLDELGQSKKINLTRYFEAVLTLFY